MARRCREGTKLYSFRKSQILELARVEGRVAVDALAERFGVTSQTIRRDLSSLAHEGKLDRVHGGATLPSGATNIRYNERRRINAGAKAAIAKVCAANIPNNSSVFLNIGTSTEAVALELLGHENLTVVTNNINVANILVANDSCQIVVTGGVLRHSDGGLVGDLATEFVEQFKVDHAIIGVSALDEDGDLLDFDIQEVRVSREIIRQSKKTFLVTDSSKLDRNAPVKIASLRDIDAVFIDSFPVGLAEKCRDWDTAVHLVGNTTEA
ncbi:DeoR/GlpR family DNA-binding transcription regulator [Hyphococcus sp.]|uniref:DeoR/GlpR family DNA-binding transcription regulator n=1 Tax=Hyphococcus sp. TaxID=2038636 RepID=UPI0035C74748